MRSNYQRALRYAMKCCPPLYKDIAHTAYIRHFNKHGTNLFDQPIYTILRYVRNVWFNEINQGRYMKDGKYYNRQYYTPTEEWTEDTTSVMLRSTSVPADKQLMSKEFYEELFKRVDEYSSGRESSIDTKILRQFLEYIDSGYTYPEICKEMGMSTQRIHYYKKKLQKIIKDMDKEGMRSPFNGDATKVKKKITRKVFENNKDEYKNYRYDPELGCDFNEFYQLVTDGNDFILIREKAD